MSVTELSSFDIGSFSISENVYRWEGPTFSIPALGIPAIMRVIKCCTCNRERVTQTEYHKNYGAVLFRPLDHDPHCPARNHVYLEGIGPMIEPRAMVFEKETS